MNAGNVFAYGNHRALHTGALQQGGFNFSQFDSKTAQLDLGIQAAEKFDVTAGGETAEVAGFVEPVGRMIREGIGNEFFSREVRPAKVAACQARAADMQFTGFAGRHKLHLLVQKVDAIVGYRPADRDRLIRMKVAPGGDDRGFGGAVGVDHPATGQRPSTHEILRAGFSSDNQKLHAGNIIRQHRQQRGDAGENRDFRINEYCRECGAGVNHLRSGGDDCGTVEKGQPYFFNRGVKRDRETLEDAVAWGDVEYRRFSPHQMAGAAMRDLHSFGLARGAGGVDDVAEIMRTRSHLLASQPVGGLMMQFPPRRVQ